MRWLGGGTRLVAPLSKEPVDKGIRGIRGIPDVMSHAEVFGVLRVSGYCVKRRPRVTSPVHGNHSVHFAMKYPDRGLPETTGEGL